MAVIMLFYKGYEKRKKIKRIPYMKYMKKKSRKQKQRELIMKTALAAVLALVLAVVALVSCSGGTPRAKETEDITMGIDVARYQGTIDWQQVADSGVDFAMVRVGYRSREDGSIVPDPNARYNMQEAQKYGVKLGIYFFSTAISEEEAVEEADWVADTISQYAITYPVVYDCEGFNEPESRQYMVTKSDRTDFALAFLETIEEHGYEGMFYGSKNDLQSDENWYTSRINKDYKIWVAQYPETVDPVLDVSSYAGEHQMWQYATNGEVPGISTNVDLNIAYFGYDGINEPMSKEKPEEAFPDVEAMFDFQDVYEEVTAKEEVNLRSIPSQGEDSEVLHTLKNGEVATRIAVDSSGWSKVTFNGETCYAVSSYLTTDLDYDPDAPKEDPDGIQTEFREVNEQVTAKDVVNLRTLPSVTHEDSQVVTQLKKGDIATRTGINEDVGWSRVDYNGQILYCVSSYLTAAN